MSYRDKEGYILKTHIAFPIPIIEQALRDWKNNPESSEYETHIGLCFYFKKVFDISYERTDAMLRETGVMDKDDVVLAPPRDWRARVRALEKILELNQGRRFVQTRKE